MPFGWVGTISARKLIMQASSHEARPLAKKQLYGSTWLRNGIFAFSRRIARTCMFQWADAMQHGLRNIAFLPLKDRSHRSVRKSVLTYDWFRTQSFETSYQLWERDSWHSVSLGAETCFVNRSMNAPARTVATQLAVCKPSPTRVVFENMSTILQDS